MVRSAMCSRNVSRCSRTTQWSTVASALRGSYAGAIREALPPRRVDTTRGAALDSGCGSCTPGRSAERRCGAALARSNDAPESRCLRDRGRLPRDRAALRNSETARPAIAHGVPSSYRPWARGRGYACHLETAAVDTHHFFDSVATINRGRRPCGRRGDCSLALSCQAFDLETEWYKEKVPTLEDLGGVRCGCPEPTTRARP